MCLLLSERQLVGLRQPRKSDVQLSHFGYLRRDRTLGRAIDALDLAAVSCLLTRDPSPLSRQSIEGMSPLHYSIQRYHDTRCWSLRTRNVSPLEQVLVESLVEPLINKHKPTDVLYDIRIMENHFDGAIVASEKKRRAKQIVLDIIVAVVQNDKNDVLEWKNKHGYTALQAAVQTGDLDIINALVDAGANVLSHSDSNETALHLAAKCDEDVLKYFLDNHDIRNTVDNKGYAPIHYAVKCDAVESAILLIERFESQHAHLKIEGGRILLHEIAGRKDFAINQHVLKIIDCENWLAGANETDDEGNTPVFIAASLNHELMTALLLRRGASLSVHKGKRTVISEISANFANPSAFIEELFDDMIDIEENYYAYINYEVLTDAEDMSQVDVIEQLVKRGHSALLQHPMIESLICLKWKCFLPVFYIFVATHVVFLGSFHTLVITTFIKIDTSDKNQSSNATLAIELQSDSCGWQHWLLVALNYFCIIILFAQECFWIYISRLKHIVRQESWVRMCGLGLAAAVPVVVGCSTTPDSLSWQRIMTCAALLLVWLQAMLLLSRFPGWGFYAFGKVAINLLKILVKSTCFVVGFSTCFMILYKSRPPFDGPIPAFVKTLVMMSSEFDYEDLFADDHDEELRYTKPIVRLLFIIFVIFIAIVLMNFMIGVAVSDINELNKVGSIRRLEKQLELLSNFEVLESTALGNWWPRFSHIRFPRKMCIMANNRDKPYYVKHTLLECYHKCCKPIFNTELCNAIFRIAKTEKQNLHTFDALYEAIVGAPYYMKSNKENDNSKSHVTMTTMNNRFKLIEIEIMKPLDQIKSVNDRMKLIEDSGNEIKNYLENISDRVKDTNIETKQYVDGLKKANNRIESIENINREIKESIKDLKSDLDNMIKIFSSVVEKTNAVTETCESK